MTRRPPAWLAALLAALSLAACVGSAAAAGPWRGQVVDVETDRPLEGVVVLAVWDKISPGMIHHRREFHDVDEVVTDTQGRFVIPARSRLTLNPLVTIDGPNLLMFKGGYGERGSRNLPQFASKHDVWELMEKTGVVFTLKPVRTRKERSETWPFVPFEVPSLKIPRFFDAINRERRSYGFEPIR
jgi:hypothetical protein